MGHIEGNKCKIIKRDDFHRHRAEQQIQKDAFEEVQGGALHSETVVSTGSDPDPFGGASLLENHRLPMSQDGPAPSQDDTWGVGSENYQRQANDMSRQMSDLALDKYPALIANPSMSHGAGSTSTQQFEKGTEAIRPTGAPSDLLNMHEEPQVTPGQSNVWEARKTVYVQQPRVQGISPNLLDSTSSINLLDSSIIDRGTTATRGTHPSHNSYPGNTNANLIPPSTRPENQDPNAPNAKIQTRPQLRMPSRDQLQSYWNAIEQCYVCPGSKCGQRLRSAREFEEHLLSGAHIAGRVSCPVCLKKFKTTTALVAHAESGSTKCDLRKTEEFDLVIQQITAGLIRVQGNWSGAGNAKFASVPIGQW